jgi:hypothetical protein
VSATNRGERGRFAIPTPGWVAKRLLRAAVVGLVDALLIVLTLLALGVLALVFLAKVLR